jgi:hypothetical protein
VSKHRSGHRRARHRRRFVAVAVVVAVGGAAAVAFALRDSGIERFCGRPDDLRTNDGVTLTADAMDAFVAAETAVGHDIVVVQSYRTCREQRTVCERICGSKRGCPGLCAPPGLSWHQRALAVDVTQDMLDAPGVIDALESLGWCQPLPSSDPGHFSFSGCH